MNNIAIFVVRHYNPTTTTSPHLNYLTSSQLHHLTSTTSPQTSPELPHQTSPKLLHLISTASPQLPHITSTIPHLNPSQLPHLT